MFHFRHRRTLTAVIITGILGLAGIRAADAKTKKVTTVEGISEYALGNGLKVLLFPDNSKPTFTVNITYHVGSRHEGRGEAGMAHLLEHMVFKGTPTFPNIWGVLEDHGASFNGTTWVDRTNYFESLPYSDKNLEFAIRMEADRMVNSLISGEELEKEMTVVRNEFEQGENSPSGVLGERMLSSAYLWHNYGKSTIGNRSDIERVPVENLQAFYRKYYQPDNATLIVAGKFEPDHALQLIEKYFASIPRPERVLESTYTEEPAQDGPRMVTLRRVGDVATVGLVYHIPAGSHPDFAAVETLEDILTNQPGGYLYRRLVASGLASSVRGVAFSWAEPGVIQFMAQVADGQQPEQVLAAMVDTVENVATAGITEQDVQRAVRRGSKRYKLAMMNASRVGISLSESIALGDWRLFFLHRDRLEKVKVADVQRVAAHYLVESNRTAGMFVPTESPARSLVPARPDIAELVEGYQGRDEVAAGEAIEADVDYLESRIVRKVLPSGIKLAMLPIERRGDSVRASFRFHFGDEAKLTGNTTAANMIPGMLMRGTERLSFQQLRDEIDRLESQIRVGGGGNPHGGGGGGDVGSVGASIQSDRAHFRAALDLLAEILQKPAFRQEEFDIIKQRRLSMMQQMKSSPQSLGMRALRRATSSWPRDSIHYVPTVEEAIERVEQVGLEDVIDLYRDLYGASYTEIAIVGDFDPERAAEQVEKLFGDWKSPTPYVRIESPYREIPEAASLVIDTPDKEMAMVAQATKVSMKDTDDDYPALVLASYVLGSSAKSRLMNSLRHEGGLSYGAYGGFSASAQDNEASLMCMAICAPQNAELALEKLRSVIARWIDDGLTEEEIEDAKQSYELKFRSSLGDDRSLVRRLLNGLELDRTLEFQQHRVDAIKALQKEQIQSALRRTFDGAIMVDVKAGDVAAEEAVPQENAAANQTETRTDVSVSKGA